MKVVRSDNVFDMTVASLLIVLLVVGPLLVLAVDVLRIASRTSDAVAEATATAIRPGDG